MIKHIAQRSAPLAALAMGAGLAGCSVSYDFNEVDGVPLSEFDQSGDAPTEVSLAGSDQVIITEGDSLSITLDGSDKAGEAMRFERSGDRLNIARDSNVYDGSEKAIVRIEMPAPAGLKIAGSGEIESAAMASDAEVDIAGSGSITIAELEAAELDVDIAGSGSVSANAGSVERLTVDIAGSGNVGLGDVMADDVEVEIAGSGNVNLASDGTVDAEIAGSGQITVTGSASCSVDSAGSGSLTCRPAASTAEADDEATEEEAATEE